MTDKEGNITVAWTTWFTNVWQKQKITASDTFTTADAKVVTVLDGIISEIV
jgi:hypothetical protein